MTNIIFIYDLYHIVYLLVWFHPVKAKLDLSYRNYSREDGVGERGLLTAETPVGRCSFFVGFASLWRSGAPPQPGGV